MKKAWKITGIIVLLMLVIIIGIINFTDFGQEVRDYIIYKIFTPRESVEIENQEHIKITYKYSWEDGSEGFDIDVTDKDFIKMLHDNISNKKLNNYSGQIGLLIMGQYKVYLGNNISFAFDYYDDDGYVMMSNESKSYLTKINPEILEKVVQIVDEKLTKEVSKFKTDKINITMTEKGENDTVLKKNNIEINEKSAIEYIINQCKNVYTKQINYEPNIVNPDYEIDFNNDVKLWLYNGSDKGWMHNGETLSEAYGLSNFNTFLENTFKNELELKKQMFTADKISIISPDKQIELTDKESVEKITTILKYSKIYKTDWLEDYDISEEYDTGIKVKINDNVYLIPSDKSIGNRYIVDKDKKIYLCFSLTNIEQYIYELLEIKEEEYKGSISTGI